MNLSLLALAAIGLAVVALAVWWVRQEWKASAGRQHRARSRAERERADDLRDCRVAHESLAPDRSEGGAEDSSDDPGASGAPPGSERDRAEERWKRAYSTSSKLDPDLPAKRGGES